MTVLNGEKHIREAIDSILIQTFKDWELLIVAEPCSDRTSEIITSYSDKRIRLIQNDTRLGVAASPNKGLDVAQGEYIARMDSDDISLPDRLKKQVRFMDANPDIGISGAWTRYIGDNAGYIGSLPCKHEGIQAHMFFESGLANPCVIMRRRALEKFRLRYDTAFSTAEDYDLWERASHCFHLANLPEVLLLYRSSPLSQSRTPNTSKKPNKHKIYKRILEQSGFTFSIEEYELHCRIGDADNCAEGQFLLAARTWLEKLKTENKLKKVYDQKLFARCLADRWLLLCRRAVPLGPRMMKIFASSSLAWHISPTLRNAARLPHFLLHCLHRKDI